MFKDESEFKKVVNRLNIDTRPNQKHRDDLRRQMLNVFNQAKQKSQKPKTPFGALRSTIMKSHITKLAAAAVIIVAILVGLPFLSSNGSSVALADVLDRVEQAKAFMYKMEMTMAMVPKPAGKQQIKGTAVISDEYGMKARVEIADTITGKTVTQQLYFFPDRKLMLTLIPEEKKCMRVELDEDLFVRKKKENNDPREMLKQILACKYTELGRSEIDGIEVEGFKTTDPVFSSGMAGDIEVKLWVDVKTWLPVLWEMDMKKNEFIEIHTVVSDFQWDIPVDASDFEPVIPADYTFLEEDGYKMSSMPRETARVYREKSIATDHYDRGEAHYLDGQYDQAFSELTKAIEKDPTLVRAYVTRGMAYEDKDEHDLAIADFTKIIELKPTDPHAYRYRGMAYGNKGQYDLAVADYNKSIEIDPMIADAYSGRARIYYYKGEYDKAWKDVNKAQALGQQVDSKLLEKLRKASEIVK